MRYFVLLILLSPFFSALAQQDCRSAEYKASSIIQDHGLASRLQQIEQFTKQHTRRSNVVVTGGDDPASELVPEITIPVIVHIIYNSAAQNISDEQVWSQILVLNRDYHKLNADSSKTPAYYSDLAAPCHFRFVLAGVDTNGNAISGILRKHTNMPSFNYNDAVKYSSSGGDDAWDRDRYLNIWVCNLTEGVLGYSSVPGQPKEVDGVVISFHAFGTIGTAAAPFNLGRTTTHEIGHWLNLIHIWGDADCGDDLVEDTPPQHAATRGNPSGMIFSCNNGPYGNLYMDFMDFTDDAGMHLFTYGQRDRMRSLFVPGGFREPLLHSDAAVAGSNGNPPSTTDDGSFEMLAIYPNPTVNTVRVIMSSNTCLGSQLQIFTLTGQLIRSVVITDRAMLVDVSSLATGCYFMKIRGKGQSQPRKLVKM